MPLTSRVRTPALSGSLTKLANGSSYLLAGSNVTIVTGSSGAVTISSSASSTDSAASYLVLSTTASLSNERAFVKGTGLSASDGGAGGNYTLSIDNTTVATISGSRFTGNVITATDFIASGNLKSLNSVGDEGGEIFLNKATTNTTITGGVVIDVYQNRLRFFEESGATRGFYLDITAGGAGASTNLGLSFFSSTTSGSVFTTGSLAVRGGESAVDAPSDKGSDVFFYVSGSTTAGSGVSLFGGNVTTSGSLRVVSSTSTGSFGGNLEVTGTTHLAAVSENLVNSVGGTGTVNFNLASQGIFYVNGPTGDITANFQNVPTTNLRVITPTVILSQSSTARIVSAVQIDGASQTVNWANNVTPTGTANKQDVFGFSLIRSGSAWKVLGQMSTYG